MTTVYVDTRALFVGGAADPNPARLAPDAGSALDHLRKAGLEVVLLGDADAIASLQGAVRARLRLHELPQDPQGWMLAGNASACARGRPCRRLRTILVGPATPGSGLASRACDVEARDLTDAVLTILAAEAMGPAREMATPAPAP